jgi:hypothetical protein
MARARTWRVIFSLDRIGPLRSSCFRWHPFALEPGLDYSREPTTLIVFELEEMAADTQLTTRPEAQ